MGVLVSRIENYQVLVVRQYGIVGEETCGQTYERLGSLNPDFDSMKIFYDLSRVEEIDLTFEQLHGLVGLRRDYYDRCGGTRIAALATTDVIFGMGRMYAALLDQFPTVRAEAFRSAVEAADYLCVPTQILTDHSPDGQNGLSNAPDGRGDAGLEAAE